MTLDELLRREGELELVTTGRRSGRPHRVTVWFAVDGGDVWLRTDATTDWYRNLAREPRCVLVVVGREIPARRVGVPDEAAALRRVVELMRAKYGAEWVGDWYVERGRVPVRLRPDGA